MDRSNESTRRFLPLKNFLRRRKRLKYLMRIFALMLFCVFLIGLGLFGSQIWKEKPTTSSIYQQSLNKEVEINNADQLTNLTFNGNKEINPEGNFTKDIIPSMMKILKDEVTTMPKIVSTTFHVINITTINRNVQTTIANNRVLNNQPVVKQQQTVPKRILFWTPLYTRFENWQWWFDSENLKQECPNITCIVSSDRNTLNESDAIVFQVYSDNTKLDDLPKYRKPNQRWTFFTIEPPEILLMKMYKNLNGFFNWTMTYRLDSDIPLYYGGDFKISDSKNSTNISKNYAQGKFRLVVWFVSHCPTDGRRENYVKELQNYIEVDIYGDCGNKACTPKRSQACYDKILGEYKFYLAFENIICKDYVTEKLFNILAYPIVPIVFGGANYSALAPKKSFINAFQFPKPKHLAEYLKMLNKNDSLYNEFFDWKRGKELRVKELTTKIVGCGLCSKLYENSLEEKIYSDLFSWWFTGSKCLMWDNSTFKPLKLLDTIL